MEVILLEKIRNLGGLGEKVPVKPGYARNYLVPKGKAVPATTSNLAAFETRRAELEKAQGETLAYAQTRSAKLKGLPTVCIAGKVGVEGKLFGSVNAVDIAKAVTAAGVEITRQEVRLPTGPLRYVGVYDIEIALHPDVEAVVKVQVVPEE
jgi:large subunit ribosomal protein L9